MGRKGIETLVGAFVLLGLLGLVFLALQAANLGASGGGALVAFVAPPCADAAASDAFAVLRLRAPRPRSDSLPSLPLPSAVPLPWAAL